MKRLIFLATFLILNSQFSILNSFAAPVDNVNTLVGSQSTFALSVGNTYPAVAMPWGMNFWTPQTGAMGDGWQYGYTAERIRGFKQTHQPSPWINDYGQFSLMPVTSEPVFDEQGRASWFSHKAERATPYYYSVYLADHDTTVELAPTERAAAFRITYPKRELSYMVVDAFDRDSWVKVVPEEQKIVGYTTRNSGGVPDNFKNWFVIISDTPFDYVAAVEDGKINVDALTADCDHTGAIVGFKTQTGQKVHFRVASSFISLEQAELNLSRELGADDFDTVVAKGRARWNEVLGRVEIKDDNIDNIRTFYSCLYRSVLFPRTLTEYDASGAPVHYSPYNGEVKAGEMFTDTGFWDTFRALFPLLNLLYPDTNARIQQGLVNAWLESGFLPEWASPGHRNCMVGNNSASVVADGFLSGVTSREDAETLWQAVIHGANSVDSLVPSTGRLGWEYYNKLGYVPYNVGIHENVARTLEYAYDDWCIYQFGKALGCPESEIEPYRQRAMNYKNVFDPTSKLMRGRNEDGSFQSPFSPFKWGDAFTEGNSWHYTWSVFHDPAGLIALMGGADEFNRQMDTVFEVPPVFDDSYYGFPIHEIREMQIMNMGNYAHGNQPIQHMTYLYNWSAQPWKTQKRVREVMHRLYSATPDGYCGDEDNGQTSAWYVFSALGFYPVCPASGEYALGSPLFDRAVLHLPNGKKTTIRARKNSEENIYVRSLRVRGLRSDRNFITLSELRRGGRIVFTMSAEPNFSRGTSDSSAPYSFSQK